MLLAEVNQEKLVQAVTDAATELSGARFGSFFYNVRNETGESYMLYTLSGVPREHFAHFPMPRATDLFGPTFRGEGPVRIADVKKDPRYGKNSPYYGMPPGHLPVTSYLAVPVISRSGEVIGGLFFGHPDIDVFSERHERIVISLAAEAAVAMDNARLLESIQKTTEDLHDAHEQLTNVLESINDAFVALDHGWRCTYINSKALEITRKTREEAIGRNVWELFSEAVHTKFHVELRRVMKHKTAVHFEEFYAPSQTWLEANAYPTRFGLAVFARDITQRKRFEEQLRQTQKLESLGVLAGGVAHDFNNLLVGILGNASLALESISPASPVREMLQDVVKATEQAAHLTKQLLAYAGKGRFFIQAIDLSEMIKETVSLLQTSIPRSVQLRLNLAGNLPCIEADATQMQQLLMNLVINGAEAIGENTPGMVMVTTALAEMDEPYIRQVLAAADQIAAGTYVSLEVHDNGSGMDEATTSRIFDPFFTTKFTGRGLGLAAVLGIVRGHKGALKVYSTPGKGSTFKIFFPATAEPLVKPPAPASQGSLSGKGVILVIDDEEIVRRTAKKTLERYGYDVLIAENGQEGVSLFQALADKISMVLLDLTMPVLSGEEALRQLKSIRPNAKIVLSSGFNEVEAIQRFAGKGLAGFIQKPYTAAALAEQIKLVIG